MAWALKYRRGTSAATDLAEFAKSIAESDRRNLQDGVIVVGASVSIERLEQHMPHLIFAFQMFNGNMFPLFVKTVSGRVTYANEVFRDQAELLSDSPRISHLQRLGILIRQWVPKEVVPTIRVDDKGFLEFGFNGLQVIISSKHEALEGREFRLQLPGVLRFNSGDQWHARL